LSDWIFISLKEGLMLRKTEILLVGTDERTAKGITNQVRIELRERETLWEVVSNFRQTYRGAIEFIPTRPELDVVFARNDLGFSKKGLTRFCEQLADVLATHSNKPSVALDHEMSFFAPIFDDKGVVVRNDNVANMVYNHWYEKHGRT
jgi:hypothetical protein